MIYDVFDTYLLEPNHYKPNEVVDIYSAQQLEENQQNKQRYYIIHDWKGCSSEPWALNLAEAIAKRDDTVVYQVDWTNATQFGYLWATHNVKVVGKSLQKYFCWC